jgi:hypothetical protein
LTSTLRKNYDIDFELYLSLFTLKQKFILPESFLEGLSMSKGHRNKRVIKCQIVLHLNYMKRKNMKLMLLIYASIITLSPAYEFMFQITVTSSKESKCNLDFQGLKFAIEHLLESEGNEYLQENGFPGIFTNVKILNGDFLRQLMEKETEELIEMSETASNRVESTFGAENEELNEPNNAIAIAHRRLPFSWGGGGICSGCPKDNRDGRRVLRGLRNERNLKTFSKRDVQSRFNWDLKLKFPDVIRKYEDRKKCRDFDAEWFVEFTFL